MARKTAPASDAPPEGGGTLASIEANAERALPRDPERAVEQLRDGPTIDPEPSDDDGAGEEPGRKRVGRPRGSRNGTGKRSRSGSRHPTRAELKERAESAEARLAALEGEHAPDRAQQIEELAAAIAGAASFMADMYAAGKPEREGWRLTEEESTRLGVLWAGPLLPHMPALGAAAPWVMAMLGTGKLVMDKARTAREVAARVQGSPELTGGALNGNEAGAAT